MAMLMFYTKPKTQIDFCFNKNIIDYDFNDMTDLDLLFIDANHDYILAKWYIDTLFPLVKEGGLIHIHDIYYNQHGKGWNDVGMEANPQTHPDIIDPYVHKQLYPTIYEKYHIHGEVKIDEEDVVREHLSHNENYEFSSTTKQWSFPDCALWIKVVKKNNDDNSDLSESK